MYRFRQACDDVIAAYQVRDAAGGSLGTYAAAVDAEAVRKVTPGATVHMVPAPVA